LITKINREKVVYCTYIWQFRKSVLGIAKQPILTKLFGVVIFFGVFLHFLITVFDGGGGKGRCQKSLKRLRKWKEKNTLASITQNLERGKNKTKQNLVKASKNVNKNNFQNKTLFCQPLSHFRMNIFQER
jgi:hypothetical protein